MTVTREFASLKQAERFQNRLYNRYDSVKLIRAPIFGEAGVYSWECRR
jgi:hypothetical protein